MTKVRITIRKNLIDQHRSFKGVVRDMENRAITNQYGRLVSRPALYYYINKKQLPSEVYRYLFSEGLLKGVTLGEIEIIT